jgi:hypothetical protein
MQNLEMARAYLTALAPNAARFDFRALSDRKDGEPIKLRGSLAIWRELTRLNSAGHGIFVTVNETDGVGVSADHVTRPREVWYDDDGKAEVPPLPLAPSMTVRTSHGKRHFHWFVDDMTPEQFAGVMRCMVALGSDPAAADIARVLRLPGTLHMKGEPQLVEIIEATGKRYTGAELAAAFPAPAEPERPATPFTPSGAGEDRRRDIEAALAAIPADDRADWIKVGMALKAEFGEEGRGLWDDWSRSSAKFDARDQELKWRSFRREGVGGNSIFHMAQSCGWRNEHGDDGSEQRMLEVTGRMIARREPSNVVKPKPKSSFTFIDFKDVRLNRAPRYLVRDVLPREGIAVVWGPPKEGKSFWLFDLCMHVALGREYRGKQVRQGVVVYGCFEGVGGFEARIEAFRRERLDDAGADVPFVLMPGALDLIKRHKELIAAMRANMEGVSPAIIVLDTLARSLVGSESSDEDMAAYIRAADAIKDAFGCCVAIVHHCGHDRTRFRGHSSLLGALDAEISVTRKDDGGVIMTEVERMKDGREGETFQSVLREIDLGADDDGIPITSCVVEPSQVAEKKGGVSLKKLPPKETIALRVLIEISGEAGTWRHVEGYPKGARVVDKELWQQRCLSGGIAAGTQASMERKFRAAFEGLVAKEIVKVTDRNCYVNVHALDAEAKALFSTS